MSESCLSEMACIFCGEALWGEFDALLKRKDTAYFHVREKKQRCIFPLFTQQVPEVTERVVVMLRKGANRLSFLRHCFAWLGFLLTQSGTTKAEPLGGRF